MGEVSCDGNEGGVGEGVDGVVGKCNGTSKVRAFELLVRSHSTGHSLVESGKSLERFTLRLPEKLRKQILEANHKCSGGSGGMKRSASYDVVLQSEVGESSSSNKGSFGVLQRQGKRKDVEGDMVCNWYDENSNDEGCEIWNLRKKIKGVI
ncbi:hypothetical protein AHAS_Ahas14G0077000 [Arachis hypogaea]|uniref:Uncharacterized protein n=1 Tax=Arachis hypogaea TaxID=3818 RepID=A0A444ZDS1_ARAHY|nr:hypothetical protein Ahy_B04g069866 [Arachis hypogaea]